MMLDSGLETCAKDTWKAGLFAANSSPSPHENQAHHRCGERCDDEGPCPTATPIAGSARLETWRHSKHSALTLGSDRSPGRPCCGATRLRDAPQTPLTMSSIRSPILLRTLNRPDSRLFSGWIKSGVATSVARPDSLGRKADSGCRGLTPGLRMAGRPRHSRIQNRGDRGWGLDTAAAER